ncbi:hypothetical protein FLP10_04030 [Agromyces intestinalis]|uniref:Uncharacterized protein n=1 Tax=Agromyces intestinalis TaxID=2592652 RepID=A0A5C1YDR2_9MICO|nr:hypothetical protein [Agromyces intestinalis]QEO13680.1 hypothetical protein FLP10_04030 [Agromyces intestinalis]
MSTGLRITQQELDPLGALSARVLVASGAVIATLLAVALTIVHRDELRSVPAAALGVVLVAIAGGIAVIGTSPTRGVFTTERLGLVVVIAVGGAIAEYVSTAGEDRYLYDDYGSAVVGLLILVLAPFCSWRALALAGVLSAAVLSILVIGGTSITAPFGPLPATILVRVAVVLAMAAAAAAYSASLAADVLRWQREANRAALGRAVDEASGRPHPAARRPSPVAVLSDEVLPFLAGVMTSDRISVDDADRARDLADALRRAVREGLEATWLDDLASALAADEGVAIVVADEASDARSFTEDQRSAVAALLLWLASGGRTAALRVGLRRDEGADRHASPPSVRRAARRFALDDAARSLGHVVFDATPGPHPPTRRELRRFASLARAFGMAARTAVTGENVRVELRYVIE